MSATTTSPHSVRPGISTWPGFRRKKVTVTSALHRRAARLSRQAVEARGHVDRHHRHAGAIDRPASSAGKSFDSPAPNSASTISPRPRR